MRYTVTWTPSAQDELADIWINAPDRQAVTAAQHRIDRTLRVDAHTKGQDYDGDRMLEEWPLVVVFTVSPDDRLVEVISVTHV